LRPDLNLWRTNAVVVIYALSEGSVAIVIGAKHLSLGAPSLAGQLTLDITGGGLAAPISPITPTLNSKGLGTVAGVSGFAFSISPATGLFTGKFLDGAKVSHPFGGVLLPGANIGSATGFGLFKGAAYTGKTGSPLGATGAVEF
jgi:hypothetical protein